jgi:hypothetical protein
MISSNSDVSSEDKQDVDLQILSFELCSIVDLRRNPGRCNFHGASDLGFFPSHGGR